MRELIPVTFLLLSASLFAQFGKAEGYLVLTDETVVSGNLREQSKPNCYISCFFTTSSGTEREYFAGREIKGYGFTGGSYYSSEIKEGFFVEVLVEGTLSLYRFKERFYLKKDTNIYVLEPPFEEVEVDRQRMIKEGTKWKGVVSYLIGDCKSKNYNIDLLDFEENSLVKIVSKYNACTDVAFKVYKDSKPFSIFKYGFVVGVANSIIRTKAQQRSTMTIDYMNDSYHSFDPIVGITFTMASPRTSENWTFHTEINFIKSKYSALYVQNQAQQVVYNESYINLTTINNPFYLKYTFSVKPISFSILGGLSLDYNLKSFTQLSSERVLGNLSIITSPEMEAFDVKKNQIGSLIGFDAQLPFRDFCLNASLKYMRMSNLSESSGLQVNINRYSLTFLFLRH